MLSKQTALPFEVTPSYRPEDFIPSASNEEAYRWIEQWPDWPSPVISIHGSPASGKTHLGHIWLEKTGGIAINPQDVGATPAYELIQHRPAILIDDADQITDEEGWFHIMNVLREENTPALILSEQALAQLPIRLPDLASRLAAITSVPLHNPDDALLEAVLVKQFADHQLRVPTEVIKYIITHMERSFVSIRHLVQTINHLSLQEKRNITLPLLKKIM